jgi:hypothetical protein
VTNWVTNRDNKTIWPIVLSAAGLQRHSLFERVFAGGQSPAKKTILVTRAESGERSCDAHGKETHS